MNLAKLDWRVILTIATSAMLVQQAFSYVCQITLPILADSVAEEFGISRAWLGMYLSLQNVASIVVAMGCGGFILRYGAMRVSQLCLVAMASSLFIVGSGQLWLYPLGAILLGLGSVSTPASSHILAKVSPRRWAPTVFSIKQTGVPFGNLIGGLLIPALLGFSFVAFGTSYKLDAFSTALVMGGIVCGVALLLGVVRGHFDADRDPTVRPSFSGILDTMKVVVSTPDLRDLAYAAFAFGGMQSLFAGFFVLFLIDGLDYNATDSGLIYAYASTTAIFARIVWAWLGSTILSPRLAMALIGLVAAGAGVLTGFYSPGWSFELILAVAILYNISALSWHGHLLVETARLAPEGQVGGITGGVLSFTSLAMMIYPAIYGGILAVTDSYGIGFFAASVPAFGAFVVFLRRSGKGSNPPGRDGNGT